MHDQPLPFVSVIVPVYNDPAGLRRCLACLTRQSWPADRREVIVADNNSDTPPADIAETRGARLIVETQPGSYAARNAALAQARGEVIAFTDSDCLPRPDWIAAGVEALRSEDHVGLVGGQMRIFPANPTRPRPAELYEILTAFPQQRFVEQKHFAATGNAFTTREVLDRVGPFNAALRSGGDGEWGRRVYEAGYKLRYCDRAVVLHPARRCLGELVARRLRILGGMRQRGDRRHGPGFVGWLKHKLVLVVPEVPHLCRLMADERLRGTGQRLAVAGVALALQYAAGYERIRLALGGTPRRR